MKWLKNRILLQMVGGEIVMIYTFCSTLLRMIYTILFRLGGRWTGEYSERRRRTFMFQSY